MNERIRYLDALRGLAVVFMVQQHLLSWLWNKNIVSYSITFPQHPVMLILNFCGNFAAPLFLILAGIGASIFYEKGRVSEHIKRGLFILGCGYLLNILSPHWFEPWSWYVLHTIGFSLIICPMLLKLRSSHLLLLSVCLVFTAPVLQTWLKTPLMPGNNYMNDISRNGSIFRLMFIEGHFPVFPWIAFFIMGIVSFRCIRKGCQRWVIFMGVSLIGLGVFLGFLYDYGFFFATGGTFFRVFVSIPYIYPPLPPIIFIIMGSSLALIWLFSTTGLQPKQLSVLGRTSLTWFFVHIIIFNELFRFLGVVKVFNAAETLIVIAVTLIGMIVLSARWQRYEYKFGFEWLMRRIFC